MLTEILVGNLTTVQILSYLCVPFEMRGKLRGAERTGLKMK